MTITLRSSPRETPHYLACSRGRFGRGAIKRRGDWVRLRPRGRHGTPKILEVGDGARPRMVGRQSERRHGSEPHTTDEAKDAARTSLAASAAGSTRAPATRADRHARHRGAPRESPAGSRPRRSQPIRPSISSLVRMSRPQASPAKPASPQRRLLAKGPELSVQKKCTGPHDFACSPNTRGGSRCGTTAPLQPQNL